MRNNYPLWLLAICCWLTPFLSSAQQEPCGTDQIHEHLLSTDADYRRQVIANEQRLQEYLASAPPLADRSGAVYTIPVVVHVIHLGESVGTDTNISDAQIQSAIDRLNDVYDNTVGTSVDTQIEFCLASRRPDCDATATNGINRVDGSSTGVYGTEGIKVTGTSGDGEDELNIKALSRWPRSQYMNVWVVSEIGNNGGGSGTQGYAYFPGGSFALDGIVILYNAFGYDPGGSIGYDLKSYTNMGATFAHEVGHWLNLHHSFRGDSDANSDGTYDTCPVESDCTSEGDLVCDTEPHIRSASNCPGGNNSCTGNSNSTVVNNYMDYSSQSCKTAFTAGQSSRMQAAIQAFRPGLNSSVGCDGAISISEPTDNGSPPSTDDSNTPTGMGIDMINIGGILQYGSGNTVEDGGYQNNWCKSADLNTGTTYSVSVSNGNANNEDVKIYIDFNNNGDMDDAGEEVFTSLVGTNHVGTITIPASPTTGTPLRLRVISDWNANDITNSEYTPQYGQAEDYTIILSSPTPVEWLGFTANKNGEAVELIWQTASERNNDKFEVLRSTDGQDWKVIHTERGVGFSDAVQRYGFTDEYPVLGNNYYRIRQLDYDGTPSNSDIEEVYFRSADQIQLSPNPTDQRIISLKMDAQIGGSGQIRLFNTSGQLVSEQLIELDRGLNERMIDLSTLARGTYILRLYQAGKAYSQKIILL